MADGTEPVGTAPAAGGVTISSADVLAAMLAAKLGLAPEDYGAIYAALTALIDGAPGEATEPAEPMTDGGGVVMETDPTRVTLARADLDALTAAVKRAQDEAASAKAAAAKIEIERAEEAAQRKADADIAARSLPASVRPVLIELARAGKDDLYQSVVETSKAVPTTEEGTSTGGVNLAAIEPTEMDARVAAMLGMTIEQFRAQKARDAGVALPAQGA